jgi:acetyl-CoA/propionyl-CoA carboxylase biotin carboxyl carrier protein
VFESVLIANRGEIARRVIRTLHRLGIRAVAVYTDVDAGAPHVWEADAAVRIDSYLDADAVIAAALATQAQAVHPGYGFLSENAAFARACDEAGIAFIGPGAEALTVMGDKIRAKAHVAAHGVPVVPGFSAVGMTDAAIAEAAGSTGYPLLVKPSAGGGGKGMQVVSGPAELLEALATARRVAVAAFGNDDLLLERLLDRPRHIEVQVLADDHGTVRSLGERECTLQRRHQKVVEEAPSPIVDADLRARLGDAAAAAAASVDYRGAGTVEFLVSGDRPGEFFFIEMNTRLQVEHPVTELVTAIDLVEQQLRIAAGEPIGFVAAAPVGHAIEARVYAESPERGFLPATGDILVWRASEGVRTDSAVETGSVVTADYDPMIAKVIAFGADRAEALERLDAALAGTVVLGVDTNIGFLRTLLADPAVRRGDLDTGLIERLPPYVAPAPDERTLRAAASVPLGTAGEAVFAAAPRAPASVPVSSDPVRWASPLWRSASGWRLSAPPGAVTVAFLTDDDTIVRVEVPAALPSSTSTTLADEGGARPDIAVDADGSVWVHASGGTHRLRRLGRREAMARRLSARDRPDAMHDPDLRAPMPGAVVAVHVADRSAVRAGDRLLTIEAMKMEFPVVAAHDGVVSLLVVVGDQVRRDELVAHVAFSDGPTAAASR